MSDVEIIDDELEEEVQERPEEQEDYEAKRAQQIRANKAKLEALGVGGPCSKTKGSPAP